MAQATKGGGAVTQAFRFALDPTPSSKTCSGCGAVKPKLPLRIRTYNCESCGLVIDRDKNAALNLAALVERHVAGSGPETQNGRGADRKTRPSLAGGREAPTPHRTRKHPDKTGTFARQRANHRESMKLSGTVKHAV
jgi:hypothetical protein